MQPERSTSATLWIVSSSISGRTNGKKGSDSWLMNAWLEQKLARVAGIAHTAYDRGLCVYLKHPRLRRGLTAREHEHTNQDDADTGEPLHRQHFAEQVPRGERVDDIAERQHRIRDRHLDSRQADDPHADAQHIAGEPADDRHLRREPETDGQNVRTGEFEVSHGIHDCF